LNFKMTYKLPKLEYEYGALEPFIDAQTMNIHYNKHHQTYVDKLNDAIKEYPEISKKPIEEVLENLSLIPDQIKTPVINNGCGHSNHKFFWSILKKETEFKGEISKEIIKKYGDLEIFKKEFSNSAITLFGSGWVWLVLNENNDLEIIQLKNQDSPLSIGKKPSITLDVWEHAYYLKYQNKRADYVNAFFNVINWNKVNELLLKYKDNINS